MGLSPSRKLSSSDRSHFDIQYLNDTRIMFRLNERAVVELVAVGCFGSDMLTVSFVPPFPLSSGRSSKNSASYGHDHAAKTTILSPPSLSLTGSTGHRMRFLFDVDAVLAAIILVELELGRRRNVGPADAVDHRTYTVTTANSSRRPPSLPHTHHWPRQLRPWHSSTVYLSCRHRRH